MTASLLAGRTFADSIKEEVREQVLRLRDEFGVVPGLTVVRVGNDPASEVYVGSKVKMSRELGIASNELHLPAETPHGDLISLVRELNENADVDGILVQLPLPDHIESREVLETIDPEKDVDGFHPINVGRLHQGLPSLVPCTPAGVIEILKRSNIDIAGKHAVVLGRSNIVGKPMAALLLRENATVTVCHSRTKHLAAVCREAEILVAAIGRTAFVGAEHIGEGAVVIDVGINNFSDAAAATEIFPEPDVEKRLATIEKRGFTLVGDVNPKAAMERASYFTPVPGGVGLLTVAMLMKNTVEAAKMRRGID